MLPTPKLPPGSLISTAQWLHVPPSPVVTISIVGDFILILTERHGGYFLDRSGRRALLPIDKQLRPA